MLKNYSIADAVRVWDNTNVNNAHRVQRNLNTTVTQHQPNHNFLAGMNRTLTQQFVNSLSKNWELPATFLPLSQQDIEFLESHTLDDIVTRPPAQEDNFFKQFIVGVLTSIATQFTVQGLKSALHPENVSQEDNHKAKRQLASVESESKSKSNEQTDHSSESTQSQEKQSTNSEAKVVKKLAMSKGRKILLKEATNKVVEKIKSDYRKTADEAAEAAVTQAKNSGKRLRESALRAVRHEARQTHLAQGKAVGEFVGKAIPTVIKSAALAEKLSHDASREGLLDLLSNTVKDVIVDKLINTSAQTICKIAPEVLGKAVVSGLSTVITGIFESPDLNINEAQALWPAAEFPRYVSPQTRASELLTQPLVPTLQPASTHTTVEPVKSQYQCRVM